MAELLDMRPFAERQQSCNSNVTETYGVTGASSGRLSQTELAMSKSWQLRDYVTCRRV